MVEFDKILEVIRPGGIVSGIVVLGFTWLLAEAIRKGMATWSARWPSNRLVLQHSGSLLRYAVWGLGAMAALFLAVDLSRQALTALAGIIAVAGGFALKDVATSVLAGITLLVDRPFQVGDRITFGEHYGEVVAMGLRSVKLMTLDHNLVTIPNGRLLTDVVSCGNAGAISMMVQLDFHLGVDQDLAAARRIVTDAITTSRYAYLREPWKLVVSQVTLGEVVALRLRAKVYVLDLGYEKDLETDVTSKVTLAFAEAGLSPPAILHRPLPAAAA
ncbi:MAG: mechanosensitive ion channel [Deltaproteobacteria bacterium]|nr:mechanosensitive ion channel [Deltaproteobacteria bacterium]